MLSRIYRRASFHGSILGVALTLLATAALGAPTNTVMYGDDTRFGPMWSRPLASCGGSAGLAPMHYHVQPFFVSSSGAYDLSSEQHPNFQHEDWDGYLLLFQDTFDPNSPLTGCLIGDDDGPGGPGTSLIPAAVLSLGTQYFLVTTGFEASDAGLFDNTINGPGMITLGGINGSADLAISQEVPYGFAASGRFSLRLTVSNHGPDAATAVTVTDSLPAGLTYVADDCGGAGAPSWTWSIGNLANGGQATCTVSVRRTGGACSATSNTATVTHAELDVNPGNDAATASNATEAVTDGGFEGGTPSGAWGEASTNFATPICDAGTCGIGLGSGPRTGDHWAWMGGATAPEEASLTQNVTVPFGATRLAFALEIPQCRGVGPSRTSGTPDFLEVTVDGSQVFRVDDTSPLCGQLGYLLQTVDVSAWADGASHTLRFHAQTISAQPTDFFVDDVSWVKTTCVAGGAALEIPTLGWRGLLTLCASLAVAALFRLRLPAS